VKRVGLFIDGLNVRHRLRECKWEEMYDVGHLARSLAGPRDLVCVEFCHPPPVREQLGADRYAVERAYHEAVAKDPGVLVPPGGYMAKREKRGVSFWLEKQTDVLLASGMLYAAATKRIDVAILATADADLVPAMRRCLDLGVKVELLRFRGAVPKIYELDRTASACLRARPAHFRAYPRTESK
jgi:uncharacterized LabA/DUF88 family protein